MRVLSLELNELNFHYIKQYADRGHLPNLARLMQERDFVETDAGEAYPYLEPWIQWPTVYTGKDYAQHQIFRLGDIRYRDQPQIWDYLESHGLSVGALSPMNASNRCTNPAFFLPDPWTHTTIVADARAKKLFGLLGAIVNNNASTDMSVAGFAKQIAPLALPYLSSRSIAGYFRILPMARKYKWAKAAFLDRLLSDLFVALWQKHKPDYASLFLNAGAHIQHHHTYDSKVYTGDKSNPAWYSTAATDGVDPLIFVYRVYDELVGELMALKDTHVFITTGLSQTPNTRYHYQYRIVDFEGFFGQVGLKNVSIQPRMSRDFLLEFPSAEDALAALPVLDKVRCAGKPVFNVEDRGETLFCQVAYFGPPEGLDDLVIDGVKGNWRNSFVLVSIENAIHQATGYHIDTLATPSGDKRIALSEVFNRLCNAALQGRETLTRNAA